MTLPSIIILFSYLEVLFGVWHLILACKHDIRPRNMTSEPKSSWKWDLLIQKEMIPTNS